MSELRQAVSDAIAARSVPSHVPVDTRPECPRCPLRCVVLVTVVYPAIAGVKPRPAEEQVCVSCLRAQRSKR